MVSSKVVNNAANSTSRIRQVLPQKTNEAVLDTSRQTSSAAQGAWRGVAAATHEECGAGSGVVYTGHTGVCGKDAPLDEKACGNVSLL